MAHLHDILAQSAGRIGFDRDFVSHSWQRLTDARHLFYQQSLDFEARSELVVKEFQTIASYALQPHCHDSVMTRFNSAVRAYHNRTHNMLYCVRSQVQEVNALCMSETLETTEIESVFTEITQDCHLEEEIELRKQHLIQAFTVEQTKLTGSSFYSTEWAGQALCTGRRAVIELHESEASQALQRKLEELTARVDTETHSNNQRMAKLWEFTHAHSYLQNLYLSVIILQREVAQATDVQQKLKTVNDWCSAVQADPVDHGRLVSVLQLEAEDLSENEINQIIAPVAKNVTNVDAKVEEKKSSVTRLLEKVLSSAVKDRLYPAA